VRAALELDKEIDRLHKFHLFVVGERDDDLVVFLGDRQILARDRRDRVFDVLLALERGADLGDRRSFGDDSFSDGRTRMPMRARKPTTIAQNRSPNRVTPRWRLALST
jgi:hypothetical protein